MCGATLLRSRSLITTMTTKQTTRPPSRHRLRPPLARRMECPLDLLVPPPFKVT